MTKNSNFNMNSDDNSFAYVITSTTTGDDPDSSEFITDREQMKRKYCESNGNANPQNPIIDDEIYHSIKRTCQNNFYYSTYSEQAIAECQQLCDHTFCNSDLDKLPSNVSTTDDDIQYVLLDNANFLPIEQTTDDLISTTTNDDLIQYHTNEPHLTNWNNQYEMDTIILNGDHCDDASDVSFLLTDQRVNRSDDTNQIEQLNSVEYNNNNNINNNNNNNNCVPLSTVTKTVETEFQSNIEVTTSHRQIGTPPAQSPIDDIEVKNLSWLFNYKLDKLPHLSPDIRNGQSSDQPNLPKSASHQSNISKARVALGQKVDQVIQEATSSIDDDNYSVNNSMNADAAQIDGAMESFRDYPKKPPFTYTELIEYALEERRELTVSGIYQWISDHFSFYKSNDDRWKNSVRHNLSINPHFRKGTKAPQGAGHLWTISTRDSEANILQWEHKKKRLELFFKMEGCPVTRYQSKGVDTSPIRRTDIRTPEMDETAQAVANIINNCANESRNALNGSQRIIESEESTYTSPIYYNEFVHTDEKDDDLQRSAGEILRGVRRDVEVQNINQTLNNIVRGTEQTDYLNPLTKDEIVQECGLLKLNQSPDGNLMRNEIGSDFFVTEINPNELGVHMIDAVIGDDAADINLFGDDFNLNFFGLIHGNNVMA